MNLSRNCLLSAVVFILAISASSGVAQDQEGTLGDLRLRNHKEQLDAYWLDNAVWEQYGFRPYATIHMHQFVNAPVTPASRWAPQIYGLAISPTTAGQIDAAASKRRIQLTKYGTWH
jgi:hypothetical protein